LRLRELRILELVVTQRSRHRQRPHHSAVQHEPASTVDALPLKTILRLVVLQLWVGAVGCVVGWLVGWSVGWYGWMCGWMGSWLYGWLVRLDGAVGCVVGW
jgi:hypothetical protein